MALISNFNPAQASVNAFNSGLIKWPKSSNPMWVPVLDSNSKPYEYKTAPSPFTPQNAPKITGALSGQGTVSTNTAPLPIIQGKQPVQPIISKEKKNRDVSLLSSVIPKANAWESRPMNLFSNEEEAFQKMKADNVPDDIAYGMIKDHRKDLMKGNTGLSNIESAALLKMQQDGLSSEDAIRMLDENRKYNPSVPKEDSRPLYKKAGEGAINLMAGNIETVLKYGGNILDLGTGWKFGFGEDVKWMTEQNKDLFKDSTAFKLGSYLPDAALAVAPLGKAVQSMSALKWGALVGAWFGAAQPVLDKGSEATMWEVALWGAIGGTVGAVAWPVINKVIQKGGKYGTALVKWGIEWAGKSIGRDLWSVGKILETKWSSARNAIAGLEANEIKALKDTTTEEFKAIIDQAKKAKWSDYANTPYHEGAKKANTAFKNLEDNLADAQAKRMESIKNSGITSIDTSKVRNEIVSDIKKSFNIESINVGKDGKVSVNPTPWREVLIDTSNARDIQAIMMLEKVSKSKSPLEMMDTIKNLQNLVYDSSTPFRVSKDMGNLVKRATGNLNQTFKSQLPPEYGDIVKQMSEDIRLKDSLNKVFKASDAEVGNRWELAMKRLAKGTTTSSDARNLALKIKDRTGIDLIKEARLRQLAMDIVWDRRGWTLFGAIEDWKRGIIEYTAKWARDLTPLSKESTALARTKKGIETIKNNNPRNDTTVPMDDNMLINSVRNSKTGNNTNSTPNSPSNNWLNNLVVKENAGKISIADLKAKQWLIKGKK